MILDRCQKDAFETYIFNTFMNFNDIQIIHPPSVNSDDPSVNLDDLYDFQRLIKEFFKERF